MLKPELRQKLTELGIAFDPKAKASELRGLLSKAEAEAQVLNEALGLEGKEEAPQDESSDPVLEPSPEDLPPKEGTPEPEVAEEVMEVSTSTEVAVAPSDIPFSLASHEKFVTLANGLKVVEVNKGTHTEHKLDEDGKLMTF